MDRWQNLCSWINRFMRIVLIISLSYIFLGCTVSTSQKIVSADQKKNNANLTISSEIKSGLTINN